MSWLLDIGPTDVVKPPALDRWTEEEARAQFKKIRFRENGGDAFCPHCGSVAVLTYRTRRIYKCKACEKQFSDTSGTPFARMRIGFRDLMRIVVRFAYEKTGRSVLRMSDELDRNYKTVLLWVHKIRQELALRNDQTTLKGEVEVDGMFVGGHIRPKNVAKDRKDLRRYPWRADDRSLCIVGARERGGVIRTWVAKGEPQAVTAAKHGIERGSTVYTDKGPHWGPAFRARFRLLQVNHKEAFCTPEACTNAVESFFSLMRRLEKTYGHISGNYLDLYAAEGAWRASINKLPSGAGFGDIMRLMTRPARTPLAGYFQGKRRALPLQQSDGTVIERRFTFKGRRGATRDDVGPGPSRRPLKRFWRDRMQFIDAAAFIEKPDVIPDQPGTYMILLRSGRSLLEHHMSGFEKAKLWSRDGYDHLYTGESYGLRTRVLAHLTGDALGSTMRATFDVMVWTTSA